MSKEYIYQIVLSSDCCTYAPLMTTTSIRQAKKMIENLAKSIKNENRFRISETTKSDDYIYIEEYNEERVEWEWYGTFEIEKYPIIKYGEINNNILYWMENLSK